MTLLSILADDVTGAADTGGVFAGVGLRTVMAFDDAPVGDADVVVRSTDSRGTSAGEAARANLLAAQTLRDLSAERRPRWIYKKIDSMVRGHPGEELLAVMAGLGERRALVAPALPEHRRVTVRGQQLVDGIPVADLAATFACDGGIPVRSIPLSAVRRGSGALAAMLGATETGVVIADAESDQDLAVIVRAALDSGLRLMAGTSGLARQLASALAKIEQVGGAGPLPRRGCAVLVVAASRDRATAAQVSALEASGVPVVRPSVEMLNDPQTPIGPAVDALAAHLACGRAVMFTTTGMPVAQAAPRDVARQVAEIVSRAVERNDVDGLVLTGGDVAAVVLARLDATQLTLGGEVQPAIPWGIIRSSLLDDVPVVTKAGSFGDANALLACLRALGGLGSGDTETCA